MLFDKNERIKNLNVKSFSSFTWTSSARVVRQTVNLVTVLLLANILKPSDFGLMTMAIIVIGFLNVLRDMGITSALIQHANPTDELFCSSFWISIAIGLALTLMLFFSSPFIAGIYGQPKLTNILKVMSFGLFIASTSFVHQAILEKKIEFNKIARAEIISGLSGAAIGISVALTGGGVWSLVSQSLVTLSVNSILMWVFSEWYPSFVYRYSEIRGIARFSINLSGFNVLNYFVRNADYFLIGKFLGDEKLGIYTLAYQIMLYPIQNISQVVSRVIFPILSRFQNNLADFRKIYLKVIEGISFVTFPLMLGVFAISDLFVGVFLGDKWSEVAFLLLVFSPIGLIQSIYTPAGAIFQAMAKTGVWFMWGGVTAVLFISGFYLGLPWGIMGVAIAYLLVNIITIYPGMRIPFGFINLSTASFLNKIKINFFNSLIMFVVVISIKYLLFDILNDLLVLLVSVITGAIVYISLSFIINKEFVSELKKLINSTFSKTQETL